MRRIHRWDYIVLVLSCAVNMFVVFIPAVPPVSCLLYVTCESDRLSSEHTSIRMNTSYRFGSLCEMSKNTLHVSENISDDLCCLNYYNFFYYLTFSLTDNTLLLYDINYHVYNKHIKLSSIKKMYRK